ncbi:MAG TPA: hypothetical protein VGR27_06295 [Longimicrobiaceae bacterium]|nr:hypothetical protein [Longimicrobiaceae bacterium]
MEQVYFNFQGSAILSVLAFLGTVFTLLAAGAALVFLLVTRRRRSARWVLRGALSTVLLYGVVLIAFSLGSREQMLAPQEEKYFCEIDCHLAYSVEEVLRRPTLGDPPQQSSARGIYYVVGMKVRFDRETTSPDGGGAPLRPNPRSVAVVDATGRRYAPSHEGERALALTASGIGVPLTRPLRPGESYRSVLVFDLPPDIRDPRLLITEAGWETRLLIGHENSFLHRKTSFLLEPVVAHSALTP